MDIAAFKEGQHMKSMTQWSTAIGMAMALLLCPFSTPSSAQYFTAPFMSPYETEDLGNGLYAFRIGVRRSLFLVSDEGVIVVDPLNVNAAKILRQEIAKITDQAVKYVAYSNSFFVRSSGGQIFKDEGAQFVAHEKCAANLEETPRDDVIMPDITFSQSHHISLGNQTLELHYLGPSYGNCLTVIIARPANVMMVTNIINPPKASLPWDPTIANYHLHTLIDFFKSVEKLAEESNIEKITGGYSSIGVDEDGKPRLLPSTAPVSLIAEQRAFWEIMFDIVKTASDKGTPARLVPKRADMSRFSHFSGYDERSLGIMMRRVYSLYRIGR